MAAIVGIRATHGDIKALSKAMGSLGKDAQPIFRDIGTAVARQAAQDIGKAAATHSPQSRAMLRAIVAKRDRVPFVHIDGRQIYRRHATNTKRNVKVRDLMFAVEFGTRGHNKRHDQITRGQNQGPKSWRPTGYFFYETVEAGIPRYTKMYADALRNLIDLTVAGL